MLISITIFVCYPLYRMLLTVNFEMVWGCCTHSREIRCCQTYDICCSAGHCVVALVVNGAPCLLFYLICELISTSVELVFLVVKIGLIQSFLVFLISTGQLNIAYWGVISFLNLRFAFIKILALPFIGKYKLLGKSYLLICLLVNTFKSRYWNTEIFIKTSVFIW